MSREGGGGKVCNVVLSAACGLQKPKIDQIKVPGSVNLFGTLLSSRQHKPGDSASPPRRVQVTRTYFYHTGAGIMPPYLDAGQSKAFLMKRTLIPVTIDKIPKPSATLLIFEKERQA